MVAHHQICYRTHITIFFPVSGLSSLELKVTLFQVQYYNNTLILIFINNNTTKHLQINLNNNESLIELLK